MKTKRPTDKDFRLYASLSHVDSELILDGMIPPAEAGRTVRASRKGMISRPWAASLVLCAVVTALTVSLMMDMGLFHNPAIGPSLPDTTQDINRPSESDALAAPSMESAAALYRGMSFSELVSLMGENYTDEDGRYTFTLDTGEQLTVSTAPNDGGEPTVTGFAWLGSAGKTYNPMGLPSEILQKVQEYATDRVIPVYAMSSLIGQYDSTTPPTLDEILEDAEVHYLRTGADGEAVILDGEGHGAGGNPQGEAFSFLENVSALFDESVRVKAYYPIMTSSERGAVYFQTSIGDYILYLHGEAFTLVPDGSEPTLADPIPYLMPAAKFHEFAYGVVSDQYPNYGIGWMFSDKRMAVIEPYKTAAEGYRKPVNIATPEAAEQIKVGDRITDLTETLGICRRCATARALYLDPRSGEYILPTPLPAGLHYWELTDGSGLVIYGDMEPTFPDSSLSSSLVYLDFHITCKERVDAAVLDDMGTPTVGTCALIAEGMEEEIVTAIMGAAPETSSAKEPYSLWRWTENGKTHTVTVYWKEELAPSVGSLSPVRTDKTVASVVHTVITAEHDEKTVEVGMTQEELIALMGQSLSTEAQRGLGIFYWKLSDGRGLFVYCRPDPWSARSTELRVTDIVWLESGDLLDTLGKPSCAVVSQLIRTNMSREAVISLLGKAPGGTYVSSSTSASQLSTSSWTWEEDRETYTFTVHWLTVSDHQNGTAHIQVREMTLTEALGPNEKPTPVMAEQVTVGMTDNAVLSQMSGTPAMTDFCGDGILYVWELSDGRCFGAVLENRAPEGVESYRFTVTHTFYWDTAEEIGQPTKANAERITQGMSYAAVVALIGEPDSIRKRDNGTIQSTVHWLTDRNLLSVIIQWQAIINTKTGAIYHTVFETDIAVG